MVQLSEKELSSLNSLLNEEELLIKKFQMLAEQCEDENVKCKFNEIADKHQRHFNTLYSQLG